MDFDLADQTESTGMVAIQGPEVIDRIADLLPVDVRAMKRYQFETGSLMLTKFTVFRSGYTGEDGVEVVIPAKVAGMAMKMLAGKMDKPDAAIKPAGLAREIRLRLEAGMPLYGHELGEEIDPLSAGLGVGGRSEEGFRRRRAAAEDRGRKGRSESWSAWNWKAGGSPGRERRS